MNDPMTLADARAQLDALQRRLQVEEALDRVRARALAMRHSDELASVATVMLREEQALGIDSQRSGIGIVTEDETRANVWTASTSADDEDALQLAFHIPLEGHPAVEGLRAAWKSQDDRYVLDLTGDDLLAYLQFMKERRAGPFPHGVSVDASVVRRAVFHFFPFPEGAVSAITAEPLPEAALHELRRLTDAFAFAYTRYLDLKQAEAQAREAQIEAALERVRSRTMAMRHSDELSEVAAVIFEQLEGLKLNPAYASISIIGEEAESADLWLTAFGGGVNPIRIQVPLTGHPQVEKNVAAWKRGDPFLAWAVEGEAAVRAQAEAYAALTGDPLFLEGAPAGRQEHLEACHTYGTLGIVSYESIPAETLPILQRFARVFEQTYTRFLDLKKAEAQAREAQIEAASERVRSRTMAMRSSDELAEVSVVLFEQLKALGLRFDLTCVCEIDEQTDTATVWSTDLEGRLDPGGFAIPLNAFPTKVSTYQTWRQYAPEARKDQVVITEYTEQILQELFAWLPTLPDYQDGATAQYYQGSLEESPTRVIGHDAFFSHGYLTLLSGECLDEAGLDVLKRFAHVFEQTYTRFLDLKQAEAQAREAVRQASIDRVRAEIATMRTAADLERITPLVWRELTTLGVPFFRCGVIIVDEAGQKTEMFLSNNYGDQRAALTLPFESHPFIQHAVDAWRTRQVYTTQWSQEQLRAWVQFLMARGDLAQPDDYMDRPGPPESLALHLVPFAQGLLYVGSAEPLAADQIDLVQALADAFAVAYARYEDFKRLEAAKADVEATLDHLKATQAQLVQAEKMASLGQLTAGIAHEIKNPLNFVNNFALLATELADELRDELDAHPDKPVAAIRDDLDTLLSDLRLNTEKIEAHGRRADGIVRAMMQHARGGESTRASTDLNALLDEYVNLAYHGMRAKVPDFNVTIGRDYDEAVGAVQVVPQEIGRVFINLLNNAFYAVHEQQEDAEANYAPTVAVSTQRVQDHVEIRIADNGPGIAVDLREKIFEPFFTTKPTGSGTGLGLSLSYDIVTQGHGGAMTVESAEGEGAAFIVTLPTSHTKRNDP